MKLGGLLATGTLHAAALACLLLPAVREPGRPAVVSISARLVPEAHRPPLPQKRESPAMPALAAPAPVRIAPPEIAFDAPAAAAAAPAPVAAPLVVQVASVPAAAPPPVAEARYEPARPPDRQCAETGIARHYPRMLRERGIEGHVLLRVKVDEQGRAAEVQVQGAGSGWRLLDEAAKALTQDCRFVPARRGEQAQASWVEYPVRFALQ